MNQPDQAPAEQFLGWGCDLPLGALQKGVLQRVLFPALSSFSADPVNDRLFPGTFNFWMHQGGDGKDSILSFLCWPLVLV